MSKILGSWSGMRKYLEQEMLAESLKGRVRYGCTSYPSMDGCCIFEICVDGTPIKRFSLETVNSYFISCGYKEFTRPAGAGEYWNGFWTLLEKYPPQMRAEYTDEEFCKALGQYRNSEIGDSVYHDDPIVRMFAILDRRVGKRTLDKLKETVDDMPDWLREFYDLRCNAEKI